MSVEKFWKELTFHLTEWTYLALTMLCQLHRNWESEVMVWRLNQVHSNQEPVGMGPVVDRDLPGFQHSLAVNWVQMIAEVLLASYPFERNTIVHADVLHQCDAWWDNWLDFLGQAGSKI